MKRYSQRGSRARSINCPICERGILKLRSPELARCDNCGTPVSGEVLRTPGQLIALPETAGRHACECGYPEMRLLPDGVFWYPARGSEVLPIKVEHAPSGGRSEAWWDGCSGYSGEVTRSERLARWENARDRLEYFHGRHAGQQVCADGARPAPRASA